MYPQREIRKVSDRLVKLDWFIVEEDTENNFLTFWYKCNGN